MIPAFEPVRAREGHSNSLHGEAAFTPRTEHFHGKEVGNREIIKGPACGGYCLTIAPRVRSTFLSLQDGCADISDGTDRLAF
jgi:hypothetical protein